MDYRTLGRSDLQVSRLCLGTMTWGEQNTVDEAAAQLDRAVAAGINFIDTAEMYPVPPRPETQGLSEDYLGRWLQRSGKRSELVIASKVVGRGSRNPGVMHIRNGPRLSREHIHCAIDDSLRRLGTDYLDLYQLHWPERDTNFFGNLGYRHREDDGIALAETLRALGELVSAGKIRYIGLSNETPWGVLECLRLAREENLPRVISIQNPYNLLNRSFEIGLAEIAMREQVDLLAYSPLAFGVLSGKYLQGARPDGARLTLFERFARYSNPQAQAATEAYVALARQHGLDPAQMALAFVNQQAFLGSNIIGATTLDQLESNIASASLSLPDSVIEGVEDIHRRYTIPSP
jgi:aryl-alcohol dehydrogenase-like predicted oxidoreductase